MSTPDEPVGEDLTAAAKTAYVAANLAPDDITTTSVVTDRPSEFVALVGYLGTGSSDAYRRLYEDDSFRTWLAIATNDIADRKSITAQDSLTEGKSVVWVQRNASVVLCRSVTASLYESPAPMIAAPGPKQTEQEGSSPEEEDPGTYQWPRRRP